VPAKRVRASLLIFLSLAGVLAASVGKGVTVPSDMVLPSPRSCVDDVQYFAPGYDFPLANEEAEQLAE
jgi:hypothetical protein